MSPGGHTRHQNSCSYRENVIFEPTSDCFESQIPSPAEKMFSTSSFEEVPSFHDDFTSQIGLDKQSQNLDDIIEDHICNVDSGDDYDDVLSVTDLPKRRRSIQISDKTVKKHKNDMSDSSWVAGETVGIYGGDPISRNVTIAAIGVDVQSLAACGSYDEVFEGVGDSQEWDDVLVEEDQAQLFPDNEEVKKNYIDL